jgi:hypothetical protein
VGIRTKATRRSTASWYAGHDAARPALLAAAGVGGFAVVVTVAAGALLRSRDGGDTVVLVTGLAGYVAVVAVLVHAALRANRAAAAAAPPER